MNGSVIKNSKIDIFICDGVGERCEELIYMYGWIYGMVLLTHDKKKSSIRM